MYCALQVLRGKKGISRRAGESLKPVDFQKLKEELVKKHGDTISDKDVISAALYPKVFDDFHTFVNRYGPVDKLDTCTFLCGLDVGDEISVSDLGIHCLDYYYYYYYYYYYCYYFYLKIGIGFLFMDTVNTVLRNVMV
jgi:hypothetical protein